MTARIDHTVTSGTFSLDGETFDVENNVWVVGDDERMRGHRRPARRGRDPRAGRRSAGCWRWSAPTPTTTTSGWRPALGAAVDAPVLLHPDDLPLWQLTHDDAAGRRAGDGQQIAVAGHPLEVLHTPGHAPGAVCLYAPDLGVVFTGDTLFNGGPGATGRQLQRPRR